MSKKKRWPTASTLAPEQLEGSLSFIEEALKNVLKNLQTLPRIDRERTPGIAKRILEIRTAPKAKLCLSCQRKLNHKRRKAQITRRLTKQQEERQPWEKYFGDKYSKIDERQSHTWHIHENGWGCDQCLKRDR